MILDHFFFLKKKLKVSKCLCSIYWVAQHIQIIGNINRKEKSQTGGKNLHFPEGSRDNKNDKRLSTCLIVPC